jgi:hypothetical protein
LNNSSVLFICVCHASNTILIKVVSLVIVYNCIIKFIAIPPISSTSRGKHRIICIAKRPGFRSFWLVDIFVFVMIMVHAEVTPIDHRGACTKFISVSHFVHR